MVYRVLFVCTGNICRSPAAEFLVNGPLASLAGGVVASSAGTIARQGDPVDAPMRSVLEEHGIDTSLFASRRVSQGLVDGADLVLTMTQEQRGAIARLDPIGSRRTFTLLELAHIVAQAPASVTGFAELVPWATRHRGAAVLSAETPLDIDDPYAQPPDAHQRAVRRIESALVRTLPRLSERERP